MRQLHANINTTSVKGRLYELADDSENRDRRTFSYQGRSSSRDAMSWEPLRTKRFRKGSVLRTLLSGAFFGATLFLVAYQIIS